MKKGGDLEEPLGHYQWKEVLTLGSDREIISGSNLSLVSAIRGGADLRVYTEFRHNEHIEPGSSNSELIKEVMDFRITYLLDNRWVAGIINLRQPIDLPSGFGPRPSMSFFLYNQNAEQAIGRPYLDGKPAAGKIGRSKIGDYSEMLKYHQFDGWDSATNAPSSNFVYDFETYRFMVCDNWKEVYSNTKDGKVSSGSLDKLVDAFTSGCEIKVAISGLCDDIATEKPGFTNEHEVFVHCGSCYYYTETMLFMAASQPVVRVKPAIPLRYSSNGWDFGWLMPRSDGFVARLFVDPYTLKFHRSEKHYSMRWFIR